MMKLSIIVPVYNVEEYIHPCMESLFKQGLSDDDFELILVNDGTQDDCFGKIQDIIREHQNIIRVDQENQGLSGARNTGMVHAKGDYILFVDSDDLIVEGAMAKLLPIALRTSADLVVADFQKLSDDEISNYKPDLSETCQYEEKSGYDLFLQDLDPSKNYVWRTLYRREFLEKNNLKFIQGICYEDIPFTPECYLKAVRCVRAHCDLYLYRMGHSSITSSMSPKKAMDLNRVIERIWELKGINGLSSQVRQRLLDNLFSTFSFYLWCVSHNPNVLVECKSIVSDLKRRVPDLWFSNGFKQIFVSFFFRVMPVTYLKLRSK